MEDLLKVGVITTTHGVRGEVKVYPTTDEPERFLDLEYVLLDTGKELDEDEYYIADLLGMKVLLEDGSEFGTLKNVMETGANDVYIVDSVEYGEVLLPAIKECILDVDIETNTMTVHLMKGLL